MPRRKLVDEAYDNGVKYGKENGTGMMIDKTINRINALYRELSAIHDMRKKIDKMYHVMELKAAESPEIKKIQDKIRRCFYEKRSSYCSYRDIMEFCWGCEWGFLYDNSHEEFMFEIALNTMSDLIVFRRNSDNCPVIYLLDGYPSKEETDELRKKLSKYDLDCLCDNEPLEQFIMKVEGGFFAH